MQNEEIGRLLQDACNSKECFEALYNCTEKMIFSFALAFVRDVELCREIKHDVFVKLLSGAAKSFKGANAIGWLYTVTKNVALNALKKRKREVFLSQPQDKPHYPDNLSRLAALEILDKAKPAEREILVLHLVEDLPLKEVARLLHIPLTTVKWRYQAAIKRLRRKFKED